jgi:DNA (cytosine-5)-methyltransferase 1
VDVVFALNHWSVAIKTHSANFRNTKHVNSRLNECSPGECPAIDLLFASPECTYFSRARGGRPTSDQQRSGANDVLRWVDFHRPEWLVVENVPEFVQYGPVSVRTGRPIHRFKGRYFREWVAAIRGLGYRVEWQRLNAANYGARTSRERLFVIARRGGKSPVFPEPTHSRDGISLPRWGSAAEIIDWSIPCPSIFARERALADKTLLRLEAGVRKFVGPFVSAFHNGNDGSRRNYSPGDVLPTLDTQNRFAIAVPFQVTLRNHANGRDIAKPISTITAGGNHHGVAVPFLSTVNHGGTDARIHSIGDPLRTVTSKRGEALIVPFLIHYYGTMNLSAIGDPLDTITTKARHGLVTVITAPDELRERHLLNASPAMLKLLATMKELGVDDLGFRMLANSELAAAQGFPPDYWFAGSKADVTKQIGNSVSTDNAAAITSAIIAA